jgi:3-hydroxyacyl-CoA dehydrogenase
VGGGTMGRGIAINFLNAGISVVLLETSQPALDAAAGGVRQVYEASVAKGRIEPAELERRMALLRPSLEDSALAACDLVIEAVFEDHALKESVCRRLGEVCRLGAIIATNTSTLDVDALAQATGRAGDVIGLHFFSPAHVMRLLEVVRGAATAPDVLLTALKLAQTIGKQPVVSGVCWGFIGNRMLEVYLRETEFLLLEGATPAQVDGAVEALGMAMGPCRMLDMAGVDVGAKVVIERAKAGRLPADDSYRIVVRRLFEIGRTGQKTGRGYYRYEGRSAVPDPEVDTVVGDLARQHGIERRAGIDPQEIVERLMYPLINEGVRILEEGIAYRAGDIDVIWTSGYGFPDHLGGPMFHADTTGLQHVVDRLAHHARTRGNVHGYWTPAPLLCQLAAQGGRLQDWTRQS